MVFLWQYVIWKIDEVTYGSGVKLLLNFIFKVGNVTFKVPNIEVKVPTLKELGIFIIIGETLFFLNKEGDDLL